MPPLAQRALAAVCGAQASLAAATWVQARFLGLGVGPVAVSVAVVAGTAAVLGVAEVACARRRRRTNATRKSQNDGSASSTEILVAGGEQARQLMAEVEGRIDIPVQVLACRDNEGDFDLEDNDCGVAVEVDEDESEK